jgi:hypothetical protein
MVYKSLSTHLRTSKIKMTTTTYEYVALVVLLPSAITIYLFLNYFTPVPPFVLFVFVGLAFLITTPSQYLTTVGIIFELTGITIFGLVYDFADLRTCPSPLKFLYARLIGTCSIFVALLTFGTFVFWVLLSVRGVKQEEMGRLGEMADQDPLRNVEVGSRK